MGRVDIQAIAQDSEIVANHVLRVMRGDELRKLRVARQTGVNRRGYIIQQQLWVASMNIASEDAINPQEGMCVELNRVKEHAQDRGMTPIKF
jgi:hypothetical protein